MAAEKKQILTVKNIRNVNTENIMQSIIRNRTTTRSILAKENNISLMTVKHVVDDLISGGIIVEKSSANTDVGRNPKMLEVADCYGNIICVNLTSEDEISLIVYDVFQTVLLELSEPLDKTRAYSDQLMGIVEKAQAKLQTDSTKTIGIALFVPSAYDREVDQVNYDLIPDFKDLHIRMLFEEKFNIKNILILHDVFAAARSEYDSLNPEMESQFYFYCGYGVGGFFIHKNEAVEGSRNMAGEVGKMLLTMDGHEENLITLEEVVSISAVKKKMKEAGGEQSFTALLDRYESQDTKAHEILAPVLNTISRVLYNLLWVYNPTTVVVDSCNDKYSKVIAEFFEKFMDRMKNDAIPIGTKIRCAKYDEYHMMRGCFQMARNSWIEEVADSIQ